MYQGVRWLSCVTPLSSVKDGWKLKSIKAGTERDRAVRRHEVCSTSSVQVKTRLFLTSVIHATSNRLRHLFSSLKCCTTAVCHTISQQRQDVFREFCHALPQHYPRIWIHKAESRVVGFLFYNGSCVVCFDPLEYSGNMYRYWLWSSQLTLAVVCAGERWPSLVCD